MALDAGRPGGGAPGRPMEHVGGGGRGEATAGLVRDLDHQVALAERAMDTNAVMACGCCGLIVAPDVIVLEAVANGQEVDGPTTARINRSDGRSAWIYSTPEPSTATEGSAR